ncbi:MAG: hypothetical protein E7616_00960 [Ruminococcaceae bacterium]|nr:hypothetical protein [Oscillospiraceae bacterium]
MPNKYVETINSTNYHITDMKRPVKKKRTLFATILALLLSILVALFLRFYIEYHHLSQLIDYDDKEKHVMCDKS